ncbi:MAG: ABC transporter ATP-binding protein [Bacteroidetes bacterium GWF2_41_61]|jgi:ABC-2 type transport system ATP-binding protein|nr:MAG: ABC transporter ATP-binding protein [Bacteroidetes bacterium GWE2_40_15]OFY31822.1 MAG: ABC transporter ATP-binding protein [Bacteroidetes bacterium GWF2_41_61]PKP05873.1 MAG: ABC transporter ATP-binding protein [Bacteroidetes bacterium HGW-Bacteroidetes-5]HBG25047.1 ABC transporter ATP-binding protein [Rikenellaceae bacterium]HBZ24863.1 ABC transporter ATP-binding protein [Rikenellaceae bacterium]
MDVITCRNVVKRFNQFTALDSVSLSVPKGKIFGLLGPNGAGKTTLIRIMNQITIPDSGEVLFNGAPIKKNDIAYIGYLPEERGLYKKMKVGEQALYLARLKGMSQQDANKQLKEWFIKFGIQAWWNKKVEELSKGMAQKVQFITTVLHKPSLLILDEPFSGFDPVNVQLIRNELLDMKEKGASIILSTHNMESVEELCDNIALINKAKLIITGELDEIRRNHGKNEVEVIYRAAEPFHFAGIPLITLSEQSETRQGYRAVLGVKKEACSSEILRELLTKIDILSYRELIPRMNDIFIKLVS